MNESLNYKYKCVDHIASVKYNFTYRKFCIKHN